MLEQWGDANQLHFYFENRDRGWAIAAINAAVSFEASGAQRFSEVQQFIQTSLSQLITSNSIDLPWAIPRFFCSFTFFDHPVQSHPTFAPATAFLPEWQVMRWSDRGAILANLLIQPQSNLEDLAESVWHQFRSISATQSSLLSFPYQISDLLKQWYITDTAPFQATVASALLDIQQQRFHKLVLAHAIDVTSRLPFQAERSLHNLRQRYPDCYVFSAGNGKGQS
ncbi:MAG TPA: isochorismate synthase, partial [Coleofasciculaceae cyanobacterium]